MTVVALLTLIWAHWFSDFVVQTNYQAVNKSTKNSVLVAHIFSYTIAMAILLAWLFCGHYVALLEFVALNGVLHFLTDFVTSRTTSYLWKKEKRHLFFVVVGIDQAIHFSCLIVTFFWLT